jgi:polyhydroxybutyrate depolymerase
MDVSGDVRSYRQYLPTAFNAVSEPGLPLIIALHGIGDNMTNFSNVGFDNIADTARFIVVYPQGKVNSFSQNSWNNGTLLSSPNDDIAFLSMLIDTIKVKYNIDLNRVYFTGFSMGGIMTYHMLCALPSRIAAIASVSGPMADSDVSGCNPGRVVPVMHMHGTADGTVPYDGGLPSLSSVPVTLSFWQNNNGCSDSTVYNLPNTVPGDSITVDTISFNTCGAPLVHWRENGADHQWLYTPVNDVDATKQIWLFFRTKVHPGASQLGIENVPQYQTHITFKHPMLNIVSSIPVQEIGIYDLQGKMIKHLAISDLLELNVDLSSYATQMFIVKVLSEGKITTQKILVVK